MQASLPKPELTGEKSTIYEDHRAGCPTGQGAPTEHLAQRTRRVEMEVPGSAGGEPTMPAEVGGRKTEIGT